MRTLLLTPWMSPHRIISWERAVVLLVLGKVDVILWSTGADSFTLLVGRSFAPYTGRFLTNAALEFGVVTGNEG